MKNKRIYVSRIFSVLFVLVILFSESAIDNTISSDILFAIGLFLIAIGTVGRLWCSIYISGRKDRKLVTEGPYSISRNPLYFFSFLGASGVGFATETVTIPLAIICLFLLFYYITINNEERYLMDLFGNDFKSYYNKVPRFYPKIDLLYEPDEYIVNPLIFRKRMLDSLWFIWAAGLFELVEMLHKYKLIPVLIRIY